MKSYLYKDISFLLGFEEKQTSYINNLIKDTICEDVYESLLNKENITEIDLGFGTLYIQVIEEEIKYKFVPNIEITEDINKVIKNKEYKFKSKINKALTDRITKTYKELL